MGFLSQVAPDTDVHTKREDDNETFCGTAIAKHDVWVYEMGEDELSCQFLSTRLGSRRAMPIDISRMNVSCNFRMTMGR
jgi:hypothetical protein